MMQICNRLWNGDCVVSQLTCWWGRAADLHSRHGRGNTYYRIPRVNTEIRIQGIILSIRMKYQVILANYPNGQGITQSRRLS